MPTLHWIGKEKVINHHLNVPFKVLQHQYGFTNGTQNNTETNSGNKIIHGDNLEALKSLLPEYEGKIKCIYIDPPYNTGNENWVYNDNVNDPKLNKWLGKVVGKEAEDLTRHDKWLCMMYPRLKLLHKLLAEDGAIFISIDDNEQASLKLICDEIFGGGNFVTQFIWNKKNVVQNDAKFSSNNHEYIICFRKSVNLNSFNLLARTEEANNRYLNIDNDPKGPWQSVALHAKSGNGNKYSITFPNGVIWKTNEGTHPRLNEENLLKAFNEGRLWFGKNGKNVPRLKKYLSEVQQGRVTNSIFKNEDVGSTQYARELIKKILENNVFDTPKPPKLIERLIELTTDKSSIILDSFAGSGTTAHAVLNLNKQDGGNRKFICIEMEDYAETITAERVKRVINGYANNQATNGSFDYYTLGQTLFLEDGNLNELLEIEKIRQYIYFTETKTNLPTTNHTDNAYFLGILNDTAYYFFYQQNTTTTLHYDFLSTIKTYAQQYVIYADNCLLTLEFMQKHHIVFKKIPRDINKF